MGGCKCTFKDCGLSTASAKKVFPDRETHFFHFPIRDVKRCISWSIYSDNMDFLNLPPAKLLNKVICDFHFAETHFMNYKRERLTKTTAVPTIYVNHADKTEIDLIAEPTSWVKANQKAPIPKPFLTSSRINMTDESDDCPSEIELATSSKKTKLDTVVAESPMRILNGGLSGSKTGTPARKQLPTKGPQVTKVVKVSGSGGNFRIHEVSTAPKIVKSEVICPAQEIIEEYYEEVEPAIYATPPKPETSNDDIKPALMDSLKQIAEIKEMLNKSQASGSAATSIVKSEESLNISQSQLNKVQLFNGIKRYLSPSMIALLRMELFAAPGREYKNDEKIICQELLLLGEPSYNFLAEEWRLRLPAKKDVEGWIAQKMIDDDDDAS